MSNCWKFFEIAVKECLTLTQEEYSWKFIPQILQQETQRKTSPLPTLNEYSGNWSTTSLFENILYFFHGRGTGPPGGAWGNDFRRVPRPMGHLRNSELPSPPSSFFFLHFFDIFFYPHHPGRQDHHKSAMNVNVQKCGCEILQKCKLAQL